MFKYTFGILTLAVMGLVCLSNNVWAGEGCAHCQAKTQCGKVCRLVKEEKKVKVDCYGIKEEDFCLPGPSKPGCEHCEMICVDCEKDKKAEVQVKAKKFVWEDWIPSVCATVHTKKRLMKRTITKTIPSFKWVVEDVCSDCQPKTQHAHIAPGESVPPPPEGFEYALEEALAQSAAPVAP